MSDDASPPRPLEGASPAVPPRRRRWPRVLLAFAALLAVFALLGAWLLQPRQLAPLILAGSGRALGLEITADADAQARLRGEPQLIVRNLQVREPGAKTALLRARRVLIALPWSTLRSRGAEPTIKRIELDGAHLDLAALQAWLAKRPPSAAPPTIPSLTDGLRVRDGRLDSDDGRGWRVEAVAIDLPALDPQREARARLRGRYVDGPTRIPFDLALALSRPANGAGLALVGPLSIERGDWRLPMTATLSGPLRIGDDGVRITPATFGMAARYESGDTRVPFSLGLHGPLRFDGATWALEPVAAVLLGDGAVPNLQARGALALGRRLVVRLDGRLPAWPEAWPALPAPIGASPSPLPFALRYAGTPELTDMIGLGLNRDTTRFDSRFRLSDVLAWIDDTTGSPLPPLDGRLTTPQLDISGAMLEGVEIELDDEHVR